ncbi:MAG: ATP-binding protein [Gemmatimonadota bacterium]
MVMAKGYVPSHSQALRDVTHATDSHRYTDAVAGASTPAEQAFAGCLAHVTAAFAVTSGVQHSIIYANAAFRALVAYGEAELVGAMLTQAVAPRDAHLFTALLDRAFRTGHVVRNKRLAIVSDARKLLCCTVWPSQNDRGTSEHMVIELRPITRGEQTLALQRDVAERLLLSALREQDAAALAEGSRRAAQFLARESRRLAESLHEATTKLAMTAMSLPYVGDWCIVDMLDDDAIMHRLSIIHPDPAKQAILEELDGRWTPDPDDEFGLPAALRNGAASILADDVDEALGTAARDPEIYRALRELGVGPLLTVPLVIRDRLIGAVTFVGGRNDRPFTRDDVQLADELASRSAAALDRARAYGEAIALTARADSASNAKSMFLGMMSHELRTPLNAIGGYVDLIDMELRGPVTAAQRIDLARIRSNQRYLLGLITDLLSFTKLGSGQLTFNTTTLLATDVLQASANMIEPLLAEKTLRFEPVICAPNIYALGDREKVVQILVNLLSNAIKFTANGGRIAMTCETTDAFVLVHVADDGIGVPPDKVELIFDPFVQVNGGATRHEGGIGLGLAISRGLARGMRGNLTVETELHHGARFTLSLPRAV